MLNQVQHDEDPYFFVTLTASRHPELFPRHPEHPPRHPELDSGSKTTLKRK